ncbi:hypothetical protein KSP40_PGU015680 [Platanthera guangdongensis]|uniref:Uncharacterized protein n=1 Tax=Platanthera guangdongensis TaxID=2320717 RepID=A0ABR2LWR3_9ASPA
MQMTTDKILVKKMKVNIFDRLAANGSDLLKGADAGSDVEKFGKIALAMGFSKKFFDSAAADETQQTNRRVLFGLHRRYLKLYKELEKLGLDISLENLNNGVLVRESAHDMEDGNAITTDSCHDFIVETGNDQKKKKKRMLEKDEIHFDVTEVISKTKKKKRKCLGSSTENNAIDFIKMTKRKKKKLADSPVEDNGAEEAVSDPRAVINNENGKSFSCICNDMISFDDTLKSIIPKHIEKLASESGITAKLSKKRKHSKSTGKQKASEYSEDLDGGVELGKELHLHGNYMGNEGIWALVSGLYAHRGKITFLDLGNNEIHPKGGLKALRCSGAESQDKYNRFEQKTMDFPARSLDRWNRISTCESGDRPLLGTELLHRQRSPVFSSSVSRKKHTINSSQRQF